MLPQLLGVLLLAFHILLGREFLRRLGSRVLLVVLSLEFLLLINSSASFGSALSVCSVRRRLRAGVVWSSFRGTGFMVRVDIAD